MSLVSSFRSAEFTGDAFTTEEDQFQSAIADQFDSQPVADNHALADDREEIVDDIGDHLSFVAASFAMRKIRAKAELFARVDVPVLIVGESGAGKEIVGRLIHKFSARSGHRFLKVSCAAIEPDSLERVLFGGENGTSDDSAPKAIPLVLGNKGTILLDDIDEMPARAQAKLLCLLQDKQLSSNGDGIVDVDVRILAATRMDIEAALAEGKLRKDLYYYLSAFTITVPPLRERKDEIPLLLKHFMNRAARDYSLPARDFSSQAIVACQKYSWPGNLRELEKFVKSYAVSGDDYVPSGNGEAVNAPEPSGTNEVAPMDSNLLELAPDRSNAKSLLHSIRGEAERNAITMALGQTKWNRRAAARLLNVSYRTLLYKIQQYDMSPPRNPVAGWQGDLKRAR